MYPFQLLLGPERLNVVPPGLFGAFHGYDARFRAFDAKTGKELWTVKLPGAAEATPITYQGRDGKQYVVITATGGGFFNNAVTGDSVIAFALDESGK